MKNIEENRKQLIKQEDIIPYEKMRSYWGNELLYKLCVEHKNTTDFQEVFSKVWIIGRSYAVAIERNKKEISIEDFADTFIKWNEKVCFDDKLFGIKSEKDALTVYKLLLDFIYKTTGQYKRSFVSKYLHFHRPEWFKIYDSYTNKATKKLSNAKSNLKGAIDKKYADFCAKENDINDYIFKQFGQRLNNRDLDTLLINIGKNLD